MGLKPKTIVVLHISHPYLNGRQLEADGPPHRHQNHVPDGDRKPRSAPVDADLTCHVAKVPLQHFNRLSTYQTKLLQIGCTQSDLRANDLSTSAPVEH